MATKYNDGKQRYFVRRGNFDPYLCFKLYKPILLTNLTTYIAVRAKAEPNSTPKLTHFSVPAMQSHELKEVVNSPIHTLASVPFQWEEKPGKPRPCTELITLPKSSFNEPYKCLEPPPRLYSPSSTTVLDGPYIDVKPKFSSSSFRFLRNLKGSFDSNEREHVSTFVLGKKKLHRGNWWQRNVKLKGAGNSCVFSSSFMDSTDYSGSNIDKGGSCSARMPSFRSNGSLSSLSSKSHTWATIYEGFKQVIPWKSSKSKKEVFIV